MLPESIMALVREALNSLGDTTNIRSARSLGGSCINNAMRLETGRDVYFLKWNSDPSPGMFTSKARGLALLGSTHAIRVPAVLHLAEATGNRPAFIMLEWLEGSRDVDQASFGEQMANLHCLGRSPQHPEAYGLDHHNFIGLSRQTNLWNSDWSRFYAECRIQSQVELARQTGHLKLERLLRLERLIDRLPELFAGVERRPALIHGDLWSGNVILGPGGLAVIDPAVSYSDREAEIAYTELFGGFDRRRLCCLSISLTAGTQLP